MARRINLNHSAQAREKIRTSQLINRLCNFALGGVDPKTKDPIEMSSAQVTAALGLLRKVVPDLSQVDGAITHNVRNVDDMTDAELAGIARASHATGRRNGTAQKAKSANGSDSVH